MNAQSKKKKVLYVITKSNWGGAQKYVFELATNLPSDKYDVAVLHGGNGLLAKKLNKANIRRIHIEGLGRDVSVFNELKIFFKLILIYKKEKADVIHLNSSKIGGLGSFAGRIARVKKIIFTAHGFAFNEDRPTWQKITIKMMTYLTLFFAHKTIVISKIELNQVKNWFLVSKKISFIHNGVSKVDFIPRDDAQEFLLKKISKKVDTAKDLMWVGTISELTKNKGLKYSIESIYELQKSIDCDWDGIFVIIGDGEDKEYLERRIKDLGLEKKVFFSGFIDNAQMYLKAFDIFLLASVKEGLPYVLLEAGQAGNAVISTRVGGIGEIIDDMENGLLVRPKNEKEIMNALRYFMKDEKKISEFGKNLKETISNKFSIDVMLNKTFYLY